ncbi:hypothetical protein [Chitinophaga sp.]|uniref:hypothetical protein n=1 Tax=Chitinophaga sp. TaxID=1869181 RepID=UPI0031E46F41
MKNTLYLLLLICGTTFGQSKSISFGPYVESLYNNGHISRTANIGVGGGITAELKLLSGFSLTGSAGYARFSGEDTRLLSFDVENPKFEAYSAPYQYIPVRIGFRYKFPIPFLYVKAEGGAVTAIGHWSGQGTRAIFAPGIGVRIGALDIEAKYENWFTNGSYNLAGLKAGYLF